mmetsp:Transcript_3790/g.11235  ORF Transcript_3790/g.11235 Transcript_3790/m.11235 type:complete len:456 (-) Transcript_3790:1056-2423(-)
MHRAVRMASMTTPSPGSVKTMSAAARAASVEPSTAMPICAFFSAGASFTPSPVIAVTSPCASARSLMMRCLSAGAVRQKTPLPRSGCKSAARWASSNRSEKKSLPSQVRAASSRMPSSPPIAAAVSRESPVIMNTRTPAALHLRMASFASGRGGSRMPTTPQRVNEDSSASWFAAPSKKSASPPRYSAAGPGRSARVARARHRRGRDAMAVTRASRSARAAAVKGITDPSGRSTETHRRITESGAPLTYSFAAPSDRHSVDMDLRPRSNSRVATRANPAAHASDARCHGPAAAISRSTWAAGAPSFSASTRSAASVGSPTRANWPVSLSRASCASLQREQTAAASWAARSSLHQSADPSTAPSCGSYERPETASSRKPSAAGSRSAVAVIWFVVSVPVLSEQMTDVQPSVSTEGSRRTTTRRAAMRRVPSDRQSVMTAGSPSGIAATPSATAPLA